MRNTLITGHRCAVGLARGMCPSLYRVLLTNELCLPDLVEPVLGIVAPLGTWKGWGGLCGCWLGVPASLPVAACVPACVASTCSGLVERDDVMMFLCL